MKKNLSGLQKDVLRLYRTILREASKKDQPPAAIASDGPRICLVKLLQDPHTSSSFARDEFRKQSMSVKRNDFRTIEHKIRHGEKQLKLLQMPGVKVVGRPTT